MSDPDSPFLARLRECADELERRTGAPRWVVRAYVWATCRRLDPLEPCAKAHFGELEADARPARQLVAARRWISRLEGARLDIPVALPGRAVAS